MIAMNAAFEDVLYKKVFADSYQHGAPLKARGVKRPWRL
jgi:hypothetical protein